MKPWLLLPLAALLIGCTASTIQSRRQERLAAYQALSADQRLAVDAGQIQVGMPMDAVYIAWGKPSRVLAGDPTSGVTAIWLYHEPGVGEQGYWNRYDAAHRDRYYSDPFTTYDYHARQSVRAEVRFAGGVVKEWRRLDQPGF